MRKNEYENILRFSGLSEKELIGFDGTNGCISQDDLDKYDAILLGATGDGSIMKESYEKLTKCIEMLKIARKRGVPMLGFNYGAHLLTLAFDGSVTRDQSSKEIGSCTVKKEDGAKDDPIFKNLPDEFVAQIGHIDSIERIPPGSIHLLSTCSCKYDAWAYPDEGIYAIELQVDLDMDMLASRLINYQEIFASEPGELEHYILSLQPSPETKQILPLFFSKVVNKNKDR